MDTFFVGTDYGVEQNNQDVGAILHYALVRPAMSDESVMKYGPYIRFICQTTRLDPYRFFQFGEEWFWFGQCDTGWHTLKTPEHLVCQALEAEVLMQFLR